MSQRAQKMLGQLKKIPVSIHNSQVFRKTQGVIHKQTKGALCNHLQGLSYGFPETTSVVSYSEELDVLVVGTRNGSIRIFGAAGVNSVVGELNEEIYFANFVPYQKKLVTVSGKVNGNHLVLWKLNDNGKWTIEKEVTDNDLRVSSTLFVVNRTEEEEHLQDVLMLLGTEDGNVNLFSLRQFKVVKKQIISEAYLKSLKSNSENVNQAVISLETQKGNDNELLVAFKDGLVLRHNVQVTLESLKVEETKKEEEQKVEEPVAATATESTENKAEVPEEKPAKEEETKESKPEGAEEEKQEEGNEAKPTEEEKKDDAEVKEAEKTEEVKKDDQEKEKVEEKKKQEEDAIKEEELKKAEIEKSSKTWPIVHNAFNAEASEDDDSSSRLNSAHWVVGRLNHVVCAYADGHVEIHAGLVQDTTTTTDEEAATSEDNISAPTTAVVNFEEKLNYKPYGPHSCNGVTHVYAYAKPEEENKTVLIFANGMPSSTYGERNAVSLLNLDDQYQAEKTICLDLVTPVLDLVMLGAGALPNTLLVLCEEELLAVDLLSEEYLEMAMPYLNSIGGGYITALTWADQLPEDLLTKLNDKSRRNKSTREWPIQGPLQPVAKTTTEEPTEGVAAETEEGTDKKKEEVVAEEQVTEAVVPSHGYVVAGHAEGIVSIWKLRPGAQFEYVGHFQTASVYQCDWVADQSQIEGACDENKFPPFRPVGLRLWHPHGVPAPPIDEYRAAISLIEVVHSTTDDDTADAKLNIILGTMGGHAMIWSWDSSDNATVNPSSSHLSVDLLEKLNADSTVYDWQDKIMLPLKEANINSNDTDGFKLQLSVGIVPAGPISALHYNGIDSVLAVSTAHGFVLVNTDSAAIIGSQVVLPANPDDLKNPPTAKQAHAANALVSRGKQLRENLRSSMKRLRRFRLPTLNRGSTSSSSTAAAVTEDGDKKTEESTKKSVTIEEGAEDKKTEEETTKAPEEEEKKTDEEEKKAEDGEAAKTEPKEEAAVVKEEEKPSEEGEKADEAAVKEEPEEPKAPHKLTANDLYYVSLRSIHVVKTCIKVPESATAGNASSSTTTAAEVSVTTENSQLTVFTGNQIGSVHMYLVNADSEDARINLAKELQLQHRAPIIGVLVVTAKVHSLVCTEKPKPAVVEVAATTSNEEEGKKEEEPKAAETETKTEEKTEDKKDEEKTEDKKEEEKKEEVKTETASAAVTKSAPFIHHELIVITEEQVKVFNLPHLQPKHKHKVTALFGASSHNLAASANDGTNSLPRSSTGTFGAGNTATMSTPAQVSGRRIRNYALQTNPVNKQKIILIVLSNGQFQVLNLNAALRKELTGMYTSRDNVNMHSSAAGVNSDKFSLVLSQPSSREFVATEYSISGDSGYSHALTAINTAQNRMNLPVGEEFYVEPEPVLVPPVEEPTSPAPAEAANKEEVEASAKKEGEDEQVTTADEGKKEETPAAEQNGDATDGEVTKPTENGLADGEHAKENGLPESGAGDITLDSIKNYINSKGDESGITVSTTEVSVEKMTTVADGKVTTTVHEKTVIDGEVTKDEQITDSLPSPTEA